MYSEVMQDMIVVVQARAPGNPRHVWVRSHWLLLLCSHYVAFE